MKKKMMFLLLFAVVVKLTASAQQKAGDVLVVQIRTSAVCDMCKETLEKAMAYEKGVKSATLDVQTKVLTVAYNPAKTTIDKIRKAVNAAGYDADGTPADPRAYEALNSCCKKDVKH